MIDINITKKNEMLRAAEGTGVFRKKEIEILEELIDEIFSRKETTYRIFSRLNGPDLEGFAIFGRTPLTDFSWDIYWMVVSSADQGKGVGRYMLQEIEKAIVEQTPRAVIRVETSTRKEYSPARTFYLRQGFLEAGRIEDFYSSGDGLVTYVKNINNQKGGV